MTGNPQRVASRRIALGVIVADLLWGSCAALGALEPLGRAIRAPQSTAAPSRGDEREPPMRDPFAPLVERSAEPPRGTERARGLRGLRLGEVKVVGIVITTDARLAVLEAPDGRTYVVRANDRLADGTVQEVAGDGVLFRRSQRVGQAGDGGGREVRKGLHDHQGLP